MIMPILVLPDPRLRGKCVPVPRPFPLELDTVLADLRETVVAAKGAGLAAPQIGYRLRVVVIQQPDGTFTELINPTVRPVSKRKRVGLEGCLSVPEFYADVLRPSEVEVRWTARDGTEHRVKATGDLALAYQHEIDHLDGILFVDHLPAHARRVLLEKYHQRRREESAFKKSVQLS